MRVMVTGGAGFIGSALVRHLVLEKRWIVCNVDCLTYSGNLRSLDALDGNPRHDFHRLDICQTDSMRELMTQFRPQAVMHLAAESHVDRSIEAPDAFLKTNIMGTYSLLTAARAFLSELTADERQAFRFHHVSTDEVYGELDEDAPAFTETHPYAPNSPYSASKAASDHLVAAWHRTYALPTLITNCSNNYGPRHFPEKLIPHIILSALQGKPLPVYGDGRQIRDWLYVEDHARALSLVVERGRPGETYNIGGLAERRNIDVVRGLCSILDELKPRSDGESYGEQITFVTDRPGHDFRYAMDISKIQGELGWQPAEQFETGLRKTVQWYLDNQAWWQDILDGTYTLRRLGADA